MYVYGCVVSLFFFFEERYFYFILRSDETGCLAREEFLVIFEADHILREE